MYNFQGCSEHSCGHAWPYDTLGSSSGIHSGVNNRGPESIFALVWAVSKLDFRRLGAFHYETRMNKKAESPRNEIFSLDFCALYISSRFFISKESFLLRCNLLNQKWNYIDEEAVNLIKYQNAYQAAAKLINTADEMLETVLAMI